MKILQCACILGAVAALYSVAQRAMVREPSLAGAETLALAVLDNAHANLERDFAALAFAVADPMPVASLRATKVASADPTPLSSLGAITVASADTIPVIRVRAISPKPESPSLKVLAFDEPKPDAYFDPKPIGPANPIVVASLGLIPISHVDLATAEPPKDNFRYLAYYAYSETPPPEKPADTVLNSLQDIPVGTPIEEIRRAADAFGLDFGYMKAVAKIESDFDPKQRTGSYVGLYQLSKYEFNRYGDGDILSPRDNAIAAAYKIIVEAELFELRTHKKPTLSDLYLIHQQGIQGAEEHVSHPDRIAWQSMCATEEGQQKGEKWCKRAIWQNTLPEIKKVWKSVENLTSAAFVGMWEQRVADLYARYSKTADAAPAK
ncbi:MAG: transglycosylase [Xanthobacteraceae bacterium]